MTTLTYSARAATAAAVAVATTLTVTGNAKRLTADQLLLGFQYCKCVCIVCYKRASQRETNTHTQVVKNTFFNYCKAAKTLKNIRNTEKRRRRKKRLINVSLV